MFTSAGPGASESTPQSVRANAPSPRGPGPCASIPRAAPSRRQGLRDGAALGIDAHGPGPLGDGAFARTDCGVLSEAPGPAEVNMTLPTTPQKPVGVQPGGGTCMAIELAWARFRKFWLRRLCPGYVRDMQAKRLGDCPNCPHDIIDSRDLKYTRNICGYSFRPEDDRYAYRNRLGCPRHGFAEMLLFTLLFVLLAAPCAIAALEYHWLFWIPFAALALFELEIITFFRDPERTIPAEGDVLVSPAVCTQLYAIA